jgi:uncharacterized OB-fold protein
MATPTVTKPIPEPDEASAPFWEGSLHGELRLMKCSRCGITRLPSRKHCDDCLSEDFEWITASGRGTLRTFGVMHQRYHPGFAAEMPYVVAIVELEEGPRLPTNLVELGGVEPYVGMPLQVAWERYDDVALPKFRPV